MPADISSAALPIVVPPLRPSGRKIDVTSYGLAASRIVAESSRDDGGQFFQTVAAQHGGEGEEGTVTNSSRRQRALRRPSSSSRSASVIRSAAASSATEAKKFWSLVRASKTSPPLAHKRQRIPLQFGVRGPYMAIPDFQSFFVPVLKQVADGNSHSMAELRERIAIDLNLARIAVGLYNLLIF